MGGNVFVLWSDLMLDLWQIILLLVICDALVRVLGSIAPLRERGIV